MSNPNFIKPYGATYRHSEITGTTTYVGYSQIGEEEDSSRWSIKKIDESVVDTVVITYAEGSWDDRATLTYK